MNWGTKVIMGMIAFMLFIVGMVIYMFRMHGNDALVDDDYYEKGINYNQEYDALKQVVTDQAQPQISLTAQHIIIKLKDSATYELKLLRIADVKDDRKHEGSTQGEGLIIFDRQKMAKGLWLLELQWTSHQKKYLFKQNITL